MARLTAEARRDLAGFQRHYCAAVRPEAVTHLAQATIAPAIMANTPAQRYRNAHFQMGQGTFRLRHY